MAGCKSFRLAVEEELSELLEKVRSQIEREGGRFDGDIRSGAFSGNVSLVGAFRGRYEVTDNLVTITITDKPFVISCQSVEAKIRAYFQ